MLNWPEMTKETLTLISWNVNGIRAAVKNGFADFLKKSQADVLGLQEIKISDTARGKEEFDFANYDEYWHPAEKPGYSGTAFLSRLKPISVENGIGVPEFDREGRVQTMEFEKFYFVNAYFPNANHELSRLGYKLKFNDAYLKFIKKLEKHKPVILTGDFNVAHEEIDLARPKDNEGNSGFTLEERAWASKLIKNGFIDTFRLINKNKVQYSWWSYRSFARDRNIGWRIDYFFVSESIKHRVRDAFILDHVFGSDHCPVGIEIEI